MVTVTFDELELNAVLAGLVQVISANTARKWALKEYRDSPENQYAIDSCNMAVRHAMAAQLKIAQSLPDPEYPDDMTVAALEDGDHFAGREGQPEFNGAFG